MSETTLLAGKLKIYKQLLTATFLCVLTYGDVFKSHVSKEISMYSILYFLLMLAYKYMNDIYMYVITYVSDLISIYILCPPMCLSRVFPVRWDSSLQLFTKVALHAVSNGTFCLLLLCFTGFFD